MANMSMTGLHRPMVDPGSVDQILSRPDKGATSAVAAMAGPVIVLGAGGKIGLHLCLMLRAAGQASGRNLKIYAVSRFTTLRDRYPFTTGGIDTVTADLSSSVELAKLPDAPTVYFLAGVKFGTASSPELLEKMNVQMPRLVAERFANSRIVAFSTGCVYPFVDRRGGATEKMRPAPVGAYAESCLRREEVFTEVSQRLGTRVTLVRLNYSNEYRYGVLVDIAEKVLRQEPIDVSMGYVNVIWQSDAVSHVIQSVKLAGSPAVPINITGGEILSVRWLAEEFGKKLGVKPMIIGTETPTAWLSDASRAHKLFGSPTHTIGQMIRYIAEWLVGGGETWGKPTGFEKRDGQY